MARGSSDDWNRQRWHRETLKDFQKAIRFEAVEADGLCTCVTCGTRKPPGEVDAGHFLSRAHNSTAFCEEPPNCHVQCKSCNDHKSGNLIEYYSWMVSTYGQAAVDKLREQARQPRMYSIDELKLMRADYRRRWKARQ